MDCRVCGKPLATTNKSGVHTKCMTSADKHARLFARYKRNPTGERGNPDQWRNTFLALFEGHKDDLTILGLDLLPQTQQEAKTQYRKLMLQHHPDRGGDSDKAAEINAAFDRVTKRIDSNKRKDTGLRAQLLNPITEQEGERYLLDNIHCLQEKKDGKHILAGVDESYRVLVANKQGLETTLQKEISVSIAKIFGTNSVVDGELIGNAFWVFDILMHNSNNCRRMTYGERYRLLQSIMANNTLGNVFLVEAYFTPEDKKRKYQDIKNSGREGVVFKRVDAVFAEGRPTMGGDMLKVKFWKSCSAIVDETPTGKSSFTSYVWGKNGERVYLGNCTVQSKPIPSAGTVVEIKYLYAHNNNGGKLIQPIYLGERDDIDNSECTEAQLKYKIEE